MSKYFIFAKNLIVFCLIYREINAARFPTRSNVTARIIGGQVTSIENFKYLVQIFAKGEFECGGTLISRFHVATAGHCANGLRPRDLLVLGGATTVNSRFAIRRRVERYFLFGFNTVTLNKDVAVLKLARSMTGTNILPIGLCNSNWKTGDLVTMSGWGSLAENAKSTPSFLRTIQLPLISKARCQRLLQGDTPLTKYMFCASSSNNRDTCSGDSGGPVLYRGRLCGIVSFGYGCATGRYPGVYTSVKKVEGFIRRCLRK